VYIGRKFEPVKWNTFHWCCEWVDKLWRC